MAILYGGQSKYIMKMGRKFYIWFFVGVAFVLAFAIRLGEVAQYETAVVLMILFIVVGVFVFLAGKFTIRAKKLSFGRVGEYDIKQELLQLSNSYYVFQDVVINKGNIDFVVVGPSGVYAIEVKSHSGDIGHDGYQLTRNGRALEKDFLAQARFEERDLRKYLRQRLGKDIYVKAVLVFSNKMYLDFGFKDINGVFVLGKGSLLKFIDFKPTLDHNTIESIKQSLLGLGEL